MPKKPEYTTENEIMFLKNIGSYGPTKRNKKQCLEGYLKGCKYREVWGDLNKEEIIDFAESILGVL